MTRLRPIGRLGSDTATPWGHIESAGLELQMIQSQPALPVHERAGFANEREARRAQHLAPGDQTRTWFPPPLPPRNLRDGADAAQSASEKDSTKTTTTQEVTK
jgi:hypothetical protein